MFFAGLFAMYFTHRSVAGAADWRVETEALNIPFAAINTTILVLSSVTCQIGVKKAEQFIPRREGTALNIGKWGMMEWYMLTFLMGATFVTLQVVEYIELVHHGVTTSSGSYGSVFYITTGFHAIHVIGGLIAFVVIMLRTQVARKFSHREAQSAVVTSYYWHFVDVIWVVLFAIIYIVR